MNSVGEGFVFVTPSPHHTPAPAPPLPNISPFVTSLRVVMLALVELRKSVSKNEARVQF